MPEPGDEEEKGYLFRPIGEPHRKTSCFHLAHCSSSTSGRSKSNLLRPGFIHVAERAISQHCLPACSPFAVALPLSGSSNRRTSWIRPNSLLREEVSTAQCLLPAPPDVPVPEGRLPPDAWF